MTITADRWDWIKPSTPTGILNTWNTAPIATKRGYVYGHLTTDAKRFSLAKITSFDTSTNSIVTVHLPIKCNDDKDIP
jgi:hypothetical protein